MHVSCSGLRWELLGCSALDRLFDDGVFQDKRNTIVFHCKSGITRSAVSGVDIDNYTHGGVPPLKHSCLPPPPHTYHSQQEQGRSALCIVHLVATIHQHVAIEFRCSSPRPPRSTPPARGFACCSFLYTIVKVLD